MWHFFILDKCTHDQKKYGLSLPCQQDWRASVMCASLVNIKIWKYPLAMTRLLLFYMSDVKIVTTGDVQIWSPVIMYQWRSVLSGISLMSYRWPYRTNIHVTTNLKSTGRLPILVRSYTKLMNITILGIPTSSVSILCWRSILYLSVTVKFLLAPLARFS
jgi:hypothetical protein